MQTLKRGMKGSDVVVLQTKLTQAGYECGPLDGIFGVSTETAVKSFQKAQGLVVDGIVGSKTWAALDAASVPIPDDPGIIDTYQEAIAQPYGLPRNARDRRFSEALRLMQNCDTGQGFRYCGWKDPYLYDSKDFRAGKLGFPMPDGSLSSVVPGNTLKTPLHGGTCSPWAGWWLGWWLCANGDYNFRVGRDAKYITTWKHDHVLNGTKIPGYAEYCQSDGGGLRTASLSELYKRWEWLGQVNVLPMAHHVVLAVKVGGDGLWVEDPMNPGKPVPSGIYRFGADGNYPVVDGEDYYSGTRQTWRRLGPNETVGQQWRIYRVTDNAEDTGCPATGPFGGRESWSLF